MSSDQRHWPWNVLGIDGPAPDRDIRRAYARLLKQIDTETEQAKFEDLRRAFEQARKIAKIIEAAENKAPAEPEVQQESGPDEGSLPPREPEPIELPEPQEPVQPELSAPPAAPAPKAQDPDREPDSPAPPHHAAPPAPTPPASPWRRADLPDMAQPLHTLDDAINRMRHLVGARHWDSADWRALLNDPVLDFADAGQQFERALVQVLPSRFYLRSGPIPANWPLDIDWLTLIEDRFCWKSDGMHFHNSFPGSLSVREAYLDARREAGLDTAPTPPPPAKSHSIRPLLRALISPITLGVAILLLTQLIFYEASRSAPRIYLDIVAFLAVIIWLGSNNDWKFYRIPYHHLRRFGRFGVWLSYRSVLHSALNALLTIGVLVFLWLGLLPNLKAGWISEEKVSHIWHYALNDSPRVSYQAQDNTPDIMPSYNGVAYVANRLSSGRISADEALNTLLLPYPLIVATTQPDSAPSALGFTPVLGSHPARIRCQHSLSCRLDLHAGLDFNVETLLLEHNYRDTFAFKAPLISMSWPVEADGTKPRIMTIPENLGALLDFATAKKYLTTLYSSRSHSVHALTFGTLQLDWPEAAPSPILSLKRVLSPSGGTPSSDCGESELFSDAKELLSVNPKAPELLAELCSVPPEVLQVTWLPGQATDGEEQVGPFSWKLNSPLERVMFSLTPGQIRPADSNDPELQRLALQISDRIIEDYLTIFWDTPLPPELKAYLEAHPEIHRPSKEPLESALLAAVERQPHLTHIYRFRETLGPAVLEDMFIYLNDSGILMR